MKDVVGITCSGLCLIHCLALPALVVPNLAATGTSFITLSVLSEESAHLWLSLAMAIIAVWAFPSGWRKHKHMAPSLLAIAGFVFMSLALTMPENMEVYWTMASVFTLIVGHVMNRHFLITRNT